MEQIETRYKCKSCPDGSFIVRIKMTKKSTTMTVLRCVACKAYHGLMQISKGGFENVEDGTERT